MLIFIITILVDPQTGKKIRGQKCEVKDYDQVRNWVLFENLFHFKTMFYQKLKLLFQY